MTIIATARVPFFNRLEKLATVAITQPCPGWCSGGHAVDDLHELTTELTGQDPVFPDRRATASVIVQRHDNSRDLTLVQLTVTEGTEGGYPGFEGTQGWAGTPEQAEALAHRLIVGARAARLANAR